LTPDSMTVRLKLRRIRVVEVVVDVTEPLVAKGSPALALPKWRKMTWVILIINILFLIWVLAGIASGGGGGADCLAEGKHNQFLDPKDCQAAGAAGTAIGVALVIFLWVAVDVILGVIWLITNRRKTRGCPACGRT
jgi:hypothetical protein